MNKLYIYLRNGIFALQVLLAFLLLAEQQLQLPALVQTFGRMHPLLLHLPIGLLIFTSFIPLLRKELPPTAYAKIMHLALHVTALTAVLTALFGLFLAQEGGYGTELNWHKWTGVGLSWLTYGLLILYTNAPQKTTWFNGGLVAGLVLVIITGHLGANLTHGTGFLFAPLQKSEKELVITEATTVYDAMVRPILKDKCYACHNERKTKGELLMTTLEGIAKGGENGPIWIAGDAEESQLIQRVNLPLEHDDHMPPEGKPQLSTEEIRLLHDWIQEGADTKLTVGELENQHPLYALAQNKLQASLAASTPTYDFKAAPAKTIQELNNPFRSVMPIAMNSPALQAAIFVRQTYQPEYLEELSAVKDQLVYLNLTNLPIQDEDLNTIAQFKVLEELNLTGTDIEGSGLSALSSCEQLRSLSLSNTKVGSSLLEALPSLPQLQDLYLWNTALTEQECDQIHTQYPDLQLHLGYQPDLNEQLPLSPPTLKNKAGSVLAEGEMVELKQNFPGAEIRYTTDGSEPDSLNSPVFEQPFPVKEYTVIKARTYKKGWLTSELQTFTLFQEGLPLDTVILKQTPNKQYAGDGGRTLFDQRKGEAGNFRNGAWLGFQESPFEALFFVKDPTRQVQKIVLSYCQNMGAYIMPPVSVTVWGGPDPEHLTLLQTVVPDPPTKYEPNTVGALEVTIPPSAFSCYQIRAERITRLPQWHNGAGDKGWVFVDEVFFYP